MGSDESHFNVSVGSDGRQSHKTVSTNHNLFWWERRAEAVSNRGPSAYQPQRLTARPPRPTTSTETTRLIYWWWQCSDRYIISLSPHLHTPFPSVSPRPSSRTVSVDVKHHVYLLSYCINRTVWRSWWAGHGRPATTVTEWLTQSLLTASPSFISSVAAGLTAVTEVRRLIQPCCFPQRLRIIRDCRRGSQPGRPPPSTLTHILSSDGLSLLQMLLQLRQSTLRDHMDCSQLGASEPRKSTSTLSYTAPGFLYLVFKCCSIPVPNLISLMVSVDVLWMWLYVLRDHTDYNLIIC